MKHKDLKWLRHCADPGAGMYPGIKAKHLPDGPRHRLEKDGLIEPYIPHNPIHDARWLATPKGRVLLDEAGG